MNGLFKAQKVTFTRKSKNIRHPLLIFNKSKVFQSPTQKHLGLILDNRLSFEEYLTVMGAKISRTIALLRKLQHILPRHALITIYKYFIRPYLFFTTKGSMHLSIKKYNLFNLSIF